MTATAPGDIWQGFAEVERQVSRIYYRFSHLFLDRPELRDFWWEMAREEEQHACILAACQAVIVNFDEDRLGPEVSPEKARELRDRLASLLGRGQATLGVEEAFRIALEIEGSEIDAIYSKLIHLGGPQIAKTMENLGVPASVQRQKLKAALRRYCSDPELLRAAERL
jgi:rubrerythrin